MVVRTQSNGRQVTGLYIGIRNARRHFRKHVNGIELHLGHLHIHCDLAPDFWDSRPEIRDARLGDWLQSRIFHGRTCRTPVPMVLVPAEKNAFRLHPFQLPPPSAPGPAKDHPPRRADGEIHRQAVLRPSVIPDAKIYASYQQQAATNGLGAGSTARG